MPELIKFMVRHALVGFTIGVAAALAAVAAYTPLFSTVTTDPKSLGMIALFAMLMGLSGAATQISFALFLDDGDA